MDGGSESDVPPPPPAGIGKDDEAAQDNQNKAEVDSSSCQSVRPRDIHPGKGRIPGVEAQSL